MVYMCRENKLGMKLLWDKSVKYEERIRRGSLVIKWMTSLVAEVSFECRKMTCFAFQTTIHDWLKELAPLLQPIRGRTKTNCDSFARVFPRFAPATWMYFKLWLVHCIVCVLSDWLETTQLRAKYRKIRTCYCQIRWVTHFKVLYIRSHSCNVLELNKSLAVPFIDVWTTPIINCHGQVSVFANFKRLNIKCLHCW